MIITMDMTGEQMVKVLETSVLGFHGIFQVSGLTFTYDGRKPIWHRVLEVKVNGQPIDPEKTYRMATNNFLAAGGGNYKIFLEGTNRDDTYITVRSAMVDYIRKHSPVSAEIEGRITRIGGGELRQ
jgi:5'-nucleotidase